MNAKIIPIAAYDRIAADKEIIRRYKIVIRHLTDDVKWLRKSRNMAWPEGYVLGLGTLAFIWWML